VRLEHGRSACWRWRGWSPWGSQPHVRGFGCILILLVWAGCAPAPEPLDLSRFLRAGVDVDDEAGAVERALAAAEHRLVDRVRASGVRALGFEREDGATAVRVITGRGIAFGLDGDPTTLRDTVPLHVALVGVDLAGRDWTGDGLLDLFLEVHRLGEPRPCVAVLRVTEDGHVLESPLDMGRSVGSICAEEVRPAPGAQRPLVIAVERHGALLPSAVPTVALPLVPREGRWAPVSGDAAEAYWDAEQERRRKDGAHRTGEDGELRTLGAVRAAVELAAIARLRGEGRVAQVGAFDGHMRGLVSSEAGAAVADCARGHVLAGWPQPAPPCYTPEPHGP
jgi:hypothetical protein